MNTKTIAAIEGVSPVGLSRVAASVRMPSLGSASPARAVDAFVAGGVSPAQALNLQVYTQNAMQRALLASNLSAVAHRTSMMIIRNIAPSDRGA